MRRKSDGTSLLRQSLGDSRITAEEIKDGLGLSKSTVSRAFLRGSKQALEEINGRNLSEYQFVSIMFDGIEIGDRCVIAALGITDQGRKLLIGLREGNTENSEVCGDLSHSLIF